jgi:hypothetical protein
MSFEIMQYIASRLEELDAIHGRQRPTPVDVYKRHLQGFPLASLKVAFDKAEEEEFFPKPNKIARFCMDSSSPAKNKKLVEQMQADMPPTYLYAAMQIEAVASCPKGGLRLSVTPSMGSDILNPESETGKICWADPRPIGTVISTHGIHFANREQLLEALSVYSAFSINGKIQSHDGLLFITESDGKKTYKPVYFSWDEKENCWTIYDGKQWSEYTLEMDKKTKPTPLYSAPQLITA